MEKLPEGFGPLLAQHLREQMNQLTAAVQLLTPVIREQGERYDQYLAILNQSIYRIMRLTSNLEFTQLSEGEIAFHPNTLDVAGLCRELGAQVAPLAEGLEVVFSVEDTLGSAVLLGDGLLLRRMLLNLISNALRSAGRGGQAGLRLTGSRERVTIAVWDDGIGLGGEGADESPLQQTEGLGLGLTVARRIATLHGGTLVCDQQEARGLRAIVSLPVTPTERDGVLKTPTMGYDGVGGFAPVLVELSGILHYKAYLPEDLE